MELNTAKMLHDLNVNVDIMDLVIENRLRKVEENADLKLDETQREAVNRSCETRRFYSDRRAGYRKDDND